MQGVSIIILYNKGKKFLLQHRTDDAQRYPGKWAFFGGAIEEGETPLEAVKRECLEELNYPLENPKLILKRKREDGALKYFFIEKYNPKKKLILKEGKNMGWFEIKDLNKIKIVQGYEEILKLIIKSFR